MKPNVSCAARPAAAISTCAMLGKYSTIWDHCRIPLKLSRNKRKVSVRPAQVSAEGDADNELPRWRNKPS